MDASIRGQLEETIDTIIAKLPTLVKNFRPGKNRYAVKEEGDFAFGFGFGYAIASALGMFAIGKGRSPSDAEMDEIVNLVLRSREMRDAIFQVG